MTKQDIQERERFVEIVVRESNYSTPQERERIARLLLRHAKTHGNIQEANCNGVEIWYGESNESFSKRQAAFERQLERKETRIENRITALAEILGFGAILQGDPRGSTVKLTVPSGYTNDWGREGVCVPQ